MGGLGFGPGSSFFFSSPGVERAEHLILLATVTDQTPCPLPAVNAPSTSPLSNRNWLAPSSPSTEPLTGSPQSSIKRLAERVESLPTSSSTSTFNCNEDERFTVWYSEIEIEEELQGRRLSHGEQAPHGWRLCSLPVSSALYRRSLGVNTTFSLPLFILFFISL